MVSSTTSYFSRAEPCIVIFTINTKKNYLLECPSDDGCKTILVSQNRSDEGITVDS